MISDELAAEIREVCVNRGFMPSPALVRVVLEAHDDRLAEGRSALDAETLADLLRDLHPKAVIRKAAPSGAETDHELCTWCMVEWPCPTVGALDDLMAPVHAG